VKYVNQEFDEYLKSEGIKRRLTTTHTPEQNGVAERKNRTLVEMSRCLLLQSGLRPSFWAEAVSTANYIRNRCPTKALDGRTPYEARYGRAPNVAYFREFGCETYCLDKYPIKGKFDARSKKGLFVGYSENSKSFRIWLPDQRKIEITRDIKFLEGRVKGNETKFEDFYIVNNILDRHENEGETNKLDVELTPPSTEDGHSDVFENEENEEVPQMATRGRGRPRIIRNGRSGRPRKVYSQEEEVVVASVAEIPVSQAI